MKTFCYLACFVIGLVVGCENHYVPPVDSAEITPLTGAEFTELKEQAFNCADLVADLKALESRVANLEKACIDGKPEPQKVEKAKASSESKFRERQIVIAIGEACPACDRMKLEVSQEASLTSGEAGNPDVIFESNLTRWGIKAGDPIPQVILLQNGKETWRHRGYVAVKELIAKLRPTKHPRDRVKCVIFFKPENNQHDSFKAEIKDQLCGKLGWTCGEGDECDFIFRDSNSWQTYPTIEFRIDDSPVLRISGKMPIADLSNRLKSLIDNLDRET